MSGAGFVDARPAVAAAPFVPVGSPPRRPRPADIVPVQVTLAVNRTVVAAHCQALSSRLPSSSSKSSRSQEGAGGRDSQLDPQASVAMDTMQSFDQIGDLAFQQYPLAGRAAASDSRSA